MILDETLLTMIHVHVHVYNPSELPLSSFPTMQLSYLGGVPLIAHCKDMSNTLPDEKVATRLMYFQDSSFGLQLSLNKCHTFTLVQCNRGFPKPCPLH